VLTCYCGQYPIVDGIPILKKGVIGTIDQTADQVIALIQAGQHYEALLAMLLPPAPAPAWLRLLPPVGGMWRLERLVQQRASHAWREQVAALLREPGNQLTACDLFDLYFCQARKWMDGYAYFAFRFGQPRHLVALSLATLIRHPPRLVLDLACGFGHLTRSLVSQAQGQQVIGVDRNFYMLHAARHWIAPQAEYVCCEADAALPFLDGAFSTAFCSDAFHYFINKASSIRELKRLTQDDGCIILVTIRNSNVQHQHACLPLPPEGCQALFAGMSHCLLADSDILARYLQKQGPPLARPPDLGRLVHEPLLSVVASHRPEFLQDYGPFEDWPHAEGRLTLNPLFVEETRHSVGNVQLRRTFPTDFYEEENAECKQYLPEVVSVNAQVLVDLTDAKRTLDMERLIEQCVVLGLPERYR
jgi:SAM-dependent methyltransferase